MIFRVGRRDRTPAAIARINAAAGAGSTIDRVKAGDLRFFKRHVAIALDNWRIIHASLAGGGVVINSLNPPASRLPRRSQVDLIEDRRILE